LDAFFWSLEGTVYEWLVEFGVVLLVSLVVLFGFIKPFLMEAFYVPTESMVPTLEVGDRVLANKFIHLFSEPARGDIIIFEGPKGFESPEGEEEDLIKRVVGLPGDEITVVRGSLYVNGELQREPYLNHEQPDQIPFGPLSVYGPLWVPEGHVFVMGDNRAYSADSRIFGPVPEKYIVGEAFLRILPLNRFGSL
jgi:signal peptidase I